MKSAPTINLDYVPSRQVAAATGAVAILALIAVAMCALPWWLRLLIGMVVAGIAAIGIRRQMRPAWRHIAYGASGWRLLGNDGAEYPAQLHHHAILGKVLTLDFRLDAGDRAAGTRFRPLFAGDNIDAETRRRLLLLIGRAEVLHTE